MKNNDITYDIIIFVFVWLFFILEVWRNTCHWIGDKVIIALDYIGNMVGAK